MPVELTINPKFSAHIAKDSPFVSGGLRTYREYRDLGVAKSTDEKVHAHIVRTTAPCPPEGSGVHYHDLDFQLVYVLKGSSRVWFEGEGEFSFEAGDCWVQPPSIRHHVLDYSDDYELLEITMPGRYETVQLPDEKGPTA